MKRVLILFLVIGVLGIYGETTEGEIQAEADTTQQADTIIKVDTIGVENLQIEGDTVSTIKDSLFTEEVKKDQEEIIEKKDNSVSCCLIGKNQPEQKSKWSFGVGYVGAYNYGGPDLIADYLYRVEWIGELSLYQLLTLFNYWMNGFEMNYNYSFNNKNILECRFNYGTIDNRGGTGHINKSVEDSIYGIIYFNRTIYNALFTITYSKNGFWKIGPEIIFNIVDGQEHLESYKQYPIHDIYDVTLIYSCPSKKIGIGCGFVGEFNSGPIIRYKRIFLSSYVAFKIGQTIEVWNDSKRKELWENEKLEVGFSGINFGLKINWR